MCVHTYATLCAEGMMRIGMGHSHIDIGIGIACRLSYEVKSHIIV